MIHEPFFEVKQSQTCSFCGLRDMPCARLGRSWACYFCLRQALNTMIGQFKVKVRIGEE